VTVRVGINGFGRMGRLVVRALRHQPDLQLVHVNELTGGLATAAHLLEFDTVHGRFPGSVGIEGERLVLDGAPVTFTDHATPEGIAWQELGVQVVIEATGAFKTAQALTPHLEGGAAAVVVACPVKSDGVLNVVTGPGGVVGEAIGRHPDIDCVAFTGSTEVGRRFLTYSAETNLKRVLLELGGKSPQIVFADAADVENVAANVALAIFWNMGENCSAGSRLVVHRSRKDELLEALQAELRNWPVGDPLEPATRIGALISRSHMETVLRYVGVGRDEGARVVTGGEQILPETGGYFVPPTIFDGVSNDMRIAREEIFGPVLSVIEFESEAEAVAIANDTPYGLAASLYTENLNVAHRVARELKAGVVGVNAYSEGDMTTPFGGYKLSGFGGHDKSVHAHDQYTETQAIWIQLRAGA